jgi:hypothetical protein
MKIFGFLNNILIYKTNLKSFWDYWPIFGSVKFQIKLKTKDRIKCLKVNLK